MTMSLIGTLCTLIVLSAIAFAQQPGRDPGHANALLDVNGMGPVPGSNDVDLGGSVTININVLTNSASTEDVILIPGTLGCGALPTPWGDTRIDLTGFIPATAAPGFGTVLFFELGGSGRCRWSIQPRIRLVHGET